jgi:hypothetical protein
VKTFFHASDLIIADFHGSNPAVTCRIMIDRPEPLNAIDAPL